MAASWRTALTIAAFKIAAVGLIAHSVRAEEGGTGHYLPGATATFMDVLPGQPGFGYGNFPIYYHGSAGRARSVVLGGQVAADAKVTIHGDISFLLYQTPWQVLGGQLATGIALPYLWLDVKANVQAGPLRRSVSDSTSGLSDIQLFPLMLVWTEGDIKWGTNFSIYAPTGGFTQGRLANTGKNYWTFEPAVNFSYLSKTTGIELTAFAGLDFNTTNDATNYRSGTQFHLDMTVAQHLPLFGGIAGVGANFFLYQQLDDDSGSGATLGAFRSSTVGIGPVLSYVYPLGKVNLATEVKWLPELSVKNRFKGDIVWGKVGLSVPF